MEDLSNLIAGLTARHQTALKWFSENAGTEQNWPPELPTPDGPTFLASKAKGIYKPNWSRYALSVRQTQGGPYPDRDPVLRADGTWLYSYFQENPDPNARDQEFTNLGLLECLKDKVPIGVMRQVARTSPVRYQVLGLALVANWDAGYFFLEGFSPSGVAQEQGPQGELELISDRQEAELGKIGAFDPNDLIDGRERTMGQIVRRRGQPAFRKRLIDVYDGKCAFSGCDVVAALEAAHIVPYKGKETDTPQNGLLLRADLHTLFDLGLIAVHEETFRILIGAKLKRSAYSELAGIKLKAPRDSALSPSTAALRLHREWCGI